MARTRDPEAFAAKQAQILEVAEALFAARGFHQVGVAAICEAASMSPGALYRYFPSKAALVRALIARERDASLAAVRAAAARVAAGEPVEDALVALVVADVEALAGDGALALTLEVWAEAARDPEAAALVAEAQEAMLAAVTSLLAAAGAKGDPAERARWLLALADGASLWWPGEGHDAAARSLRAAVRALVGDLVPPHRRGHA